MSKKHKTGEDERLQKIYKRLDGINSPKLGKGITSLLENAGKYDKFIEGRTLPRRNFKTEILKKIVSKYFSIHKKRPSFDYVLKEIMSNHMGQNGLIADSEDIDHETRRIFYYPKGYKYGANAKSVTFERVNNQISEIYKKIAT